jgi:hypothetical protein
MWLAADVSGQPVGPIFKGQAVREDLGWFSLEDGTDRFSRNVADCYHPTWRKILEERRPQPILAGVSYTVMAAKRLALRPIGQLT